MEGKINAVIEKMFSRWQNGICPGGQIRIAQNGKTIYHRNFGYANVENALPITDETVFHVASVSKQFSVAAVMQLCERGLVDIDADIRTYIADLIEFSEPVTVRQLCNNVSGVRDLWTLLMLRGVRIDDTITMEDAIQIIRRQKALNFPPQSKYLYSNANFVLLTCIVERIAGQSLGAFLQANVFEPLGMTRTCVREKYWQRIDHRAQSYHDNGDEYQYAVLNFGAYGATSLHTTADDLLLWLRQYSKPTVLSQESIEFMRTMPLLSSGERSEYAAGLRTVNYGGHRVSFHSGVDAAFRAVVMHIDDLDYDIVGLSNTQNTVPLTSLTKVAKMLCTEEEMADQSYEAEKSEELKGYYYSENPDPVAWQVFDNMQLRDMYDPIPLHWEGNRLRAGRLNQYLTVSPVPMIEVEGAVTRLTKASEEALPTSAEAYAGTYHSDELFTDYEVRYENGSLFLWHFRNGTERMYQIREDTFVCGVYPCIIVRFVRGEDGMVQGISLSTARLFDLYLARIQA